MKDLQSIIAIITPELEDVAIARLIRNARYLAEKLDRKIHAFAPDISGIESKGLSGEGPIVLHAMSSATIDQLRHAVYEYDCDFLLVPKETFTGRAAKTSLSRQILESVPRPVLLISQEEEFYANPIRSLLVPLSGEDRISEALRFALKIADGLSTPVDLVHVTAPDRPCVCTQSLESVGDEVQHEYPEMMERIVSEASPYSDPRQRAHVRRFHHVSGQTADEIRKVMESEPGAVLVIEWKGVLERGHAKVVKDVVEEQGYPVFFVKAGRVRKSKLKVGPEFDAA